MLKLTYYGNPVLRDHTVEVPEVTDELRNLADEMIETMHAENGIGLAAPQVNRLERLCVVDIPSDADRDEEGHPLNPGLQQPMVLFNPVISDPSQESVGYEEGCLSFPGIYGSVQRPDEVTLSFLDRDGRRQSCRVRGLLCRCIQHEVDHLDGVLFVDRLSAVKKVALSGRLKRLRKETQQDLLV